MKILPSLLLALTLSVSLAHAADAPKGAGAGQGREKIKEMLLQKFDANKNGTLDPDEKAAAMKAYQERKGGSPKGGTPGAKGDPAKGGGPMMAKLLEKFDTNKNGHEGTRCKVRRSAYFRWHEHGGWQQVPPSARSAERRQVALLLCNQEDPRITQILQCFRHWFWHSRRLPGGNTATCPHSPSAISAAHSPRTECR